MENVELNLKTLVFKVCTEKDCHHEKIANNEWEKSNLLQKDGPIHFLSYLSKSNCCENR